MPVDPKQAMAAPKSQGEQDAGKIKREYEAAKVELRRLQDEYTAPRVREGDEFQVVRPMGHGTGKALVRVLRVKKTVQVQILDPKPWDKPPYVMEVSGGVANRGAAEANPGIRAELNRLSEALQTAGKEEERLRSEAQKAKTQTWNTYDEVKSDWVPSVYSRENVMEWFAEIVTTTVLSPQLLIEEVKTWVKSVW